MGGDNSTTTKSGLNSKPLGQAVDTIGTNLNTAMKSGVDPYAKSLYPGMSDLTQAGIGRTNTAAWRGQGGLNDAYGWAQGVVGSGGYNDALTSAQGGVQDYLRESQADAPGYARVRQDVADDTLGGVNASFLTDGRFGSGVHTDTATRSLGGVLANMDMTNNENRLARMLGGNQALAGIGQTAMGNAAGAASAMPGLFQGTLLPGQAQIGLGQIKDADALAKRQADADLFDRTKNADWNSLARASGILSGTAGAGGQTTTQSQNVPWWQKAATVGGGLLNMF